MQPIDHSRIRVYPLSQRKSLSRLEEILVDPDSPPPNCPTAAETLIEDCARRIQRARSAGASVILIYGAHLIKNGLMRLVINLVEHGWITHLATNGAGAIHDWELAYLGRTEESVRQNIPTGTFGTWDETARYIHIALMTGALSGLGYGASLGRFIQNDGAHIPTTQELEESIRTNPADPLTAPRSELLLALVKGHVRAGTLHVPHPWKEHSILYRAHKHGTPVTIHPGIGYDIITNHPIFNGAVLGRAAAMDFDLLAGAISALDGGVVLSVGTAVMGPQVFEKAISCANNLRIQQGQDPVSNHTIYVVDIQDGGGWDWNTGEPPKSSPAYYLRFCKSYSRTGGTMLYLQCTNTVFLHRLWVLLRSLQG